MPDLRIILLLVVSALVASVQGQCSSKFPTNTGHYCFKYIRELLTYSEATKKCNQMGGVVAHPSAQDWGTWKEDVRAVTRNEHTLWVGTTRNGSTWNWLNTKYDGQPIPINYQGKNKGKISIPNSAWGIGSDHKCKSKNETTGNATLVNSTSTEDQPKYCQDSEKNCAYLGDNGKLKAVDCESFEQFYVICQGPTDYSSACSGEGNCSENAYPKPISFNLCGCECPEGYYGDGYNSCDAPGHSIGIFVSIVIVIVGILIFLHCSLAIKKTKEGKALEGDALRKIWQGPIVGTILGVLFILWLTDVV